MATLSRLGSLFRVRPRRAGHSSAGRIYSAPITIWITVFFVAPLAIVIGYSFMERGAYGGVEPALSLESYRSLANPVFAQVTWVTLFIALVATVITIGLALPTAYYMARSRRAWLLLLIIVPFWTNFLIRVYAWIAILGNNGFLNDILLRVGIIDDYVQFLYNRSAVITVLVYVHLPYAILPLYATVEKFDFTLLEAARDLGASHVQSLYKVLLPNIRSGLFTAVLFTFIPIFGEYAVPQLVGGKGSFMLGNIIARELTVTRNWPLSSAISVVIMVITTAGVLLYLYLNRPRRTAPGGPAAGGARSAAPPAGSRV